MELIERYLQAVRFALPPAQRDDIIKELRDNILSQIEEKEAMLGRAPSEGEQAELLKKLGPDVHRARAFPLEAATVCSPRNPHSLPPVYTFTQLGLSVRG